MAARRCCRNHRRAETAPGVEHGVPKPDLVHRRRDPMVAGSDGGAIRWWWDPGRWGAMARDPWAPSPLRLSTAAAGWLTGTAADLPTQLKASAVVEQRQARAVVRINGGRCLGARHDAAAPCTLTAAGPLSSRGAMGWGAKPSPDGQRMLGFSVVVANGQSNQPAIEQPRA